ncbi:MFS transporter [Streptomyces sp. SID7805]|uniref:MFS transporter n=1 Tax=Streptomyces sp. SID7805 TaxID=2690328 RepID=UPI000DA6225C|nr:MFS transporter [Streptomyces sp. SID7805]
MKPPGARSSPPAPRPQSTHSPQSAHPPRPARLLRFPVIPELLRERVFRRYWTAQAVSLMGDQVSLIAIPLAAVLVLNADAADMGLLKTAELLPALLFSLPAGAWADRRARRRRVMIVSDLLRVLLVASLPAAYALNVLTFAQLYAVAFTVGALTVLFDVCNATVFVSLVTTDRLVAGSTPLLNGSRAMAFVGGPGAGGLLIQLLSAPLALLADALTFLCSGLLLARIAPAEPPPAPPAKGYVTEGLRWVLRHPAMRAMFAASGTVQFFNFMFQTLFVLYTTTELGLGAGLLGAVLGAGAIGGLIGAALAGRVIRGLGVGPAILVGFAGFTVPLLLVPLSAGPTWLVIALLFLAEFLSAIGVMFVDISSNSLSAALMPDALRSRITGASRTLNYGFRPLGALAGGALGTTLGLRPTLWMATAGAILCLLWLLPSPVPRIRTLPNRPTTPLPAVIPPTPAPPPPPATPTTGLAPAVISEAATGREAPSEPDRIPDGRR